MMLTDYFATTTEFLKHLHKDKALELADDSDTGNITDAGVQAILEEAVDYGTRTANDRLRTAHSLPLSEKKEEIKGVVGDLAKVWLYRRRPDQDLPHIDAMREQALERLDALTDIKGGAQAGSEFDNQTGPRATTYDSAEQAAVTSEGIKDSWSDVDLFSS